MTKPESRLGALAALLLLASSCAHLSRDVLGDNCYEDERCNNACVAADDERSQRYCEQLQLEVRNRMRAK
jgi:hypothetical protein